MLNTQGKTCCRHVLTGLVVELPSQGEHAAVVSIVVVDAFQLIEAIDIVPALQPAIGGVKVSNVSKGEHREKIIQPKAPKMESPQNCVTGKQFNSALVSLLNGGIVWARGN